MLAGEGVEGGELTECAAGVTADAGGMERDRVIGTYLRRILKRRERWHRDSSAQKHPMLTGVRIAPCARNSTVCLDSAVLNSSRS